MGVIKANPDQSKHLETATLKLFGIDLDVNSLRTEVYEANSRIPSIVRCRRYFAPAIPIFGTDAAEDAGHCTGRCAAS